MNKKKKSVQLDSLSLTKKADEPVTATAASRHQTAEKSGSNAMISQAIQQGRNLMKNKSTEKVRESSVHVILK